MPLDACPSTRIAHLSDSEVLTNLTHVIGTRRRVTAELVAYLGEVEARRLELREAYSSMRDFCCRKLKLSEGAAHRHIAAARVARKYPMVLELLREGRIHVTALSMLQTSLTVANHAELLAEACDKSKSEVELLIRTRFPRRDVPDAIEPIPTQTLLADAPGGGSASPSASATSPSECAQEPRPRLSALSAERFHIQFCAGSALKAKLERALNLTSHRNPKRELATVIEKGLDLLLADIEKKKLGKAQRPRRSKGTKPGDFSRKARREIYERDGEQCTYVSPSGERCQSKVFLELEHETARAHGGQGTTRNGRVYCRAHNAYEAEKLFGRKFIESRIALRQRTSDSDLASPSSCHVNVFSADSESESADGTIHIRQRMLDGDSSERPSDGVSELRADSEPESPDGAIHIRQRKLEGDSDSDSNSRTAPGRVRADHERHRTK